jgi:hypothetical protein
VSVLDQGEGFDPDAIADPLAPENILKSSGRGIFFMRASWTTCRSSAQAGRRHGRQDEQETLVTAIPDPIFLATAVEAALAAGHIQRQ